MADLSVTVAGLTFRNPVLTAAGPTSRDGATLMRAAAGGAGGLVTKTVSTRPAEVPRPNMAALEPGAGGLRKGLLNAELWSELPVERWLESEYRAALSTGLTVVASIGYTPEEVTALAPRVVETGVHALEFSTHYVGGHAEIARALRDAVDVPIFAKLSPHVDVVATARAVEEYVDGIVAVNTYGPCLRIDIETATPVLGGPGGRGWMSGSALRPIALRCVADIALAVDIPVVGVGGVTTGEDAIEFFMAGASAVQVCTAAVTYGDGVYGRIAQQISDWLDSHGYDSVDDIRGAALEHLDRGVTLSPPPRVDMELCTLCGLCARTCVYGAVLVDREAHELRIDPGRCQACGMCISVCPHRALGGVTMATHEDR